MEGYVILISHESHSFLRYLRKPILAQTAEIGVLLSVQNTNLVLSDKKFKQAKNNTIALLIQ